MSKTQTTKPAAIVKTDRTQPTEAGKPQRIAAFRAWDEAEGRQTSALLACFKVTASTGYTSPAEVAEGRDWYGRNADGEQVPSGSAVTYASTFNSAAKAAEIIGIPATIDLIDKASQGVTGKLHLAVADAMRAAVSASKAQGVTQSNATKTKAAKVVKAALATVKDKAAQREVSKAAAKATGGNKRASGKQQAATLGEAATKVAASKDWAAAGASVRLVSNTMHGAAVPDGMEAQARAFLAALEAASEAAQPFIRKAGK